MVARPSWVITWTWRPQPGRWRWKCCEHLVIQSEASKIWKWRYQDVFSRWCSSRDDTHEFRNIFFVGHVKRDSPTSDVNEANGDGSWERIYDGLVLSFWQIHPKVTLRDFQPRVIDIVQTEPRKCDRTFQNHTKNILPTEVRINRPNSLSLPLVFMHL